MRVQQVPAHDRRRRSGRVERVRAHDRRFLEVGDRCRNGHLVTPDTIMVKRGAPGCLRCWEEDNAGISCEDCGDRFVDEEAYDVHFDREQERRRGPDGQMEQGVTTGCKSHDERRAIGMRRTGGPWHAWRYQPQCTVVWTSGPHRGKRCKAPAEPQPPAKPGRNAGSVPFCETHRKEYYRDKERARRAKLRTPEERAQLRKEGYERVSRARVAWIAAHRDEQLEYMARAQAARKPAATTCRVCGEPRELGGNVVMCEKHRKEYWRDRGRRLRRKART